MGGFIKRVLMGGIVAVSLLGVTGCNKSNDTDFAGYLNNTLEYFISDTGLEVTQSEDGSYCNETNGINITVKDNLVQRIEVTEAVKGYELGDLHVGDKKKRAEKLIDDTYTSEPEVTSGEDESVSYAYQKGNRLFTVTYSGEGVVEELSMEITSYTVGSSSSDTTGSSQIEKDEIMVTVGNIDVSYSEAMVYLRAAQQIYETEFGNEVWSYDIYGNGTTIGAILKQEVLNQIIQLEVINMVANEQGITLSDDEMYEVRSLAASFMEDISEEDKTKYGITEELAVSVFATNMIAEKLYETVTIDVDTDVSDEEAMQCKILRIFIKTYGQDSKGNRTELRESELEEIKEKVEALHEQALSTNDFYALAEANSEDDTIEYVLGHDDWEGEEAEVAFSLSDGEVSDIIETEDGYVILYCEKAYDEDATLQVKEEIIEQRRSDLFVELYSEWYSQYEVKVNLELWNKLELSALETTDD